MRIILAAAAVSLLVATGAEAATKKAAPVAAPLAAPTHVYSNPTAFIASAVVVPAGYDTVYVSGIPSASPATADMSATQAQTLDVLTKLGTVLKAQGLGFGDVVNMKVYLVGDPARKGEMDFAGMNTAFKTFFGTKDQPNRPSRVTVQIAGLALPGALVEIELTAVKASVK